MEMLQRRYGFDTWKVEYSWKPTAGRIVSATLLAGTFIAARPCIIGAPWYDPLALFDAVMCYRSCLKAKVVVSTLILDRETGETRVKSTHDVSLTIAIIMGVTAAILADICTRK